MNLSISRFRVENIRGIKNLEIDLKNKNEYPNHVTLIQMPNGVGKSTTMGLIRTLLQGKDLDRTEVESYEPTEFESTEGSFELDLEFDGNIRTLQLELDYNLGTHSYYTIKPQLTGGGRVPEHDLPLEVQKMMTKSFIKLFVFDGELTDDFIGTGSDEAEEAINTVNYLDRLEDQRDTIDEIVESRRDGKAGTEQGYKILSTELQKSKSKLDELTSKKESLNEKIDELEDDKKSLEEKRESLLDGYEHILERYTQLQEEINQHKVDLRSDTKDLLSEMRSPSKLSGSFAEDLSKLHENMEILKLPKSTSQEFFRELAEGDECICGTEINDDLSTNILENSEKYLSEDDISVLNALKHKIGSLPEVKNLEDQIECIGDTREELRLKKNKKQALGVDDPDTQSKIDELDSDIESVEDEIKNKKRELKHLRTNDNAIQDGNNLTWKNNIELCKNRRNKYKDKVRQATKTVNFGKKADILDTILEKFKHRYSGRLKNKQIDRTNDRLQKILDSRDVQIKDIDDSIILEKKTDASEGQKLSTAYAYLSTLFENTALDVPFVVDNPVISIDFKKSTVVAQIMPNLFDQLIMFIIPRERDHFAGKLASNDVEYITVHKLAKPGEVEKHVSKDYFFNFQEGEIA